MRADNPDGELERGLITSAAKGDRDAFESLVRSRMHRVFNVCYRLMGDREEAGDCAQETFLKAFRSLKDFRGESSFSTWLFSIAVNTCKSRLQSSAYRGSQRNVSLADDASTPADPGAVDPIDPAPSVQEQLERHELEVSIQQAISALPPEARTVIVLRDVEGFSYEEIARMTGLAVGTVKSRIARGRMQLRERLKGVL